MVGRQADQVALPRHGDLQGLANPPGGISGQPGAVRHVESVDGLHQAADGFLQQVRVTQGMVPEALGHVRGQANVRRGEAVLQMDVTVVQAADGRDRTGLVAAVLADELGHGPRLHRRSMLAQAREAPFEDTDQLTLALPEAAQQLTLFFRR